MGRKPKSVPDGLHGRVFTVAQAQSIGITRNQLRGPSFTQVRHGWYTLAGGEPPPLLWQCVGLKVPDAAVFSHWTAIELLALPAPAGRPAGDKPHVICPPHAGRMQRTDLALHRSALSEGDVITYFGLRVTSPGRLLLDMAATLSAAQELLVLGDAMLAAGLTDHTKLTDYLAGRPSRQGVARARALVPHLNERSGSPMESRLRWWIFLAGIPTPVLQHEVHDANGAFVARCDFAWPQVRVCLEYEGRQHASGAQFGRDVGRYSALTRCGWATLRYSAAHALHERDRVLAELADLLRARGLEWEPPQQTN